eukprot:215914-Pyramimonas_sp.AAC.1
MGVPQKTCTVAAAALEPIQVQFKTLMLEALLRIIFHMDSPNWFKAAANYFPSKALVNLGGTLSNVSLRLGLPIHHAPDPTLGTTVLEQERGRRTAPPEVSRTYSRLPLAQYTNPFTKGCVRTYRPPLEVGA